MAPDLNTVPPSPRPQGSAPVPVVGTHTRGVSSGGTARTQPFNTSSPSLSRRVSQTMGPPPLPNSTSPNTGNGGAMLGSFGDNTGVGGGPGPLRHPRPLTIADIHLELEKEQEAVVNRLTRELSLLRQQTASVASTTSSMSTNLNDSSEYNNPFSPSHTTSRNRSSSTLSSRSVAALPGGGIGGGTSIAPSRDTGAPPSSRPSSDLPRPTFSRETSTASRRPSEAASPPLSSSLQQQHGENSPYTSTLSSSNRSSMSYIPHVNTAAPVPPPSNFSEHRWLGSISTTQATSRYDEVTHHRAELEIVKRENEMLRRRVRELEATLREYRSA